jgi:hypothetical protein
MEFENFAYSKIKELEQEVEFLKTDLLANFNQRLLENTEHVQALDVRMRIFVPRRTNEG